MAVVDLYCKRCDRHFWLDREVAPDDVTDLVRIIRLLNPDLPDTI
jgi:hypothetical protein